MAPKEVEPGIRKGCPYISQCLIKIESLVLNTTPNIGSTRP